MYCHAVRKCPVDTWRHKKRTRLSSGSVCWHYLFSRAVTRQVSSAQMSLTSVFGMGTGGPSSQSIPTRMDGIWPIFLYVKEHLLSNSKEIIAPTFLLVNTFFHIPWKLNTVFFRNYRVWQHWACLDQAFGLLVSVSSMHYCTYTSDLSTSSSTTCLSGDLISGRVSRLDAFSVYLVHT